MSTNVLPNDDARGQPIDTASAAPLEARIGKYRLHPVAAMFPMLKGYDYGELKLSIENHGQQEPIVVEGDVLIDGRNRLKICLELGIEPRVVEYTSALDVSIYIHAANIHRRHLTEDQRAQIADAIYHWRVAQRNQAKQIEAGTAQAHHGVKGGRGHKKPLNPNSDEGVSRRDHAADNANSTVGQIAATAKVSRHKAGQAVAVGRADPALAEKVRSGEVKLKDAAAQVKAARTGAEKKPASSPREEPSYQQAAWSITQKINAYMKKFPRHHVALRNAIQETLRHWEDRPNRAVERQ